MASDALSVFHSSDTKSEIVKVLAVQWPLNARQIFQRIKNSTGREITYQGVHKAIKQLEDSAVVVKGDRGYSLSTEWLAQTKKFVDETDAEYAGSNKLSLLDVPVNSSATVEFDSFLEAGLWFLGEMEKEYAANSKPDVAVICWRHPWPLTTLPEKDFLRLKKLLERDVHYALCASNTPLDRALMEFWQKIGKKTRIGVDVARNCDELVIHDYYLQYFVPRKTQKDMDNLFKKAEGADGETLAEYYRILYEKKETTIVVIVRNQEVANRLREDVLKFY